MTEAPATRREWLEWGRLRLRGAAVLDPGQETWWIWHSVSGESRAAMVLDPEGAVSDTDGPRFAGLIERRAGGEPLAYVLGETGFRGLTIQCDRRALIPRPETEGLVDLVLARCPTGIAVDVGTGTGCIALSLAAEGRYRAVAGLDRSAPALSLAAQNAARLGLAIHLVRGDLLSALAGSRVDVVVSNPPYLTTEEWRRSDPAVREWEPRLALVGGDDGVEAYRRLFYEGGRVVRPGGLLALEIDAGRALETAREATRAGWMDVQVLDDLFGRPRYLVAWRGEEC